MEIIKAKQYKDQVKNIKEDTLVHFIKELTLLNSDETARFNSWNAKGLAMLGASALSLTFFSLGIRSLEKPLPPTEVSILYISIYILPLLLFLFAVIFYSLATWNALVSLRPRPICRLDEDELLSIAISDGDFLKSITADKMATYKNNMQIVNEKASAVKAAWEYYFCAFIAQAAFLVIIVLRSHLP